MSNLHRVKRVMRKVLKEKEDNIIKLRFDSLCRRREYEEMSDDVDKVKKELIKYRAELDVAKLKHQKKREVELAQKVGGLEGAQQQFIQTEKEMKFSEDTRIKAEAFVERIKDCIKNPSQIYEKHIQEEINKDAKE